MEPKTNSLRPKSMWKLFGEENVQQQSKLGIRGRRGSATRRSDPNVSTPLVCFPHFSYLFCFIRRPCERTQGLATSSNTKNRANHHDDHTHARPPPPHVYLKHAQTRCCRFHVRVKVSGATRGPDINGRGEKKNRRRREEGGVRGVTLRPLAVDLRNGPGTELDSETRLKGQSSRALQQHGCFLLWKTNKQKKRAETLKPWRRGIKVRDVAGLVSVVCLLKTWAWVKAACVCVCVNMRY